MDYENPSRSDYYLIQLAAEVKATRQAMAAMVSAKGTKFDDIHFKDFILKFRQSEQEQEQEKAKTTLEEADARSKQFWMMFVAQRGKN